MKSISPNNITFPPTNLLPIAKPLVDVYPFQPCCSQFKPARTFLALSSWTILIRRPLLMRKTKPWLLPLPNKLPSPSKMPACSRPQLSVPASCSPLPMPPQSCPPASNQALSLRHFLKIFLRLFLSRRAAYGSGMGTRSHCKPKWALLTANSAWVSL